MMEKEFGQDDFKKQKEKGGMPSKDVDRSTYEELYPVASDRRRMRSILVFTVVPLMINNLILKKFLEEKVWTELQ